MKKLLIRIILILLAGCICLSMTACGEAKPAYPTKAELNAETLTYSKEELEALKSGTHYAADTDVPALYKYFEGRVKIGVAFTTNQIRENAAEELHGVIRDSIIKHYNMYTLGNEFKPDFVNPQEGVYNFTDADEFVAFAEAAGADVRGHTLLWHSQVPQWWFKADPADTRTLEECKEAGALCTSEVLQERITKYITDVVTRYKDTVDVWDVCNEVLNADSIRRFADDSYWADIMGDIDGNGYYDDYVEIAFNAARAADEDAVLMINDFNMEWQNSKTNAMYDMVERMLRKGVRIDGVGFQSHIGLDCNVENYRQNIAKIASLADIYDECFPEHKGNFRVQITELDMNMFVGANSDGSFIKWTDEDFEKQAAKYRELMDMFMDFVDDGVIDAIVFWGTDDENSWLNTTPKLRRNASLLFDRDLSLKPAYYAIAEASFR